jgi:hypothetical protein
LEPIEVKSQLSKKSILILFLFFLVVIAGGVLLWRFYNKTTPQNQDNVVEVIDPIEAQMNKIIESGNFEACGGIKDMEYKRNCEGVIAQNIALASLDYDWCLKMDDQIFSRSSCILDISISKAKKNNDVAVCNELGRFGYRNIKELCIFNYWENKAFTEKDTSVCSNLVKNEEKEQCINEVNYSK